MTFESELSKKLLLTFDICFYNMSFDFNDIPDTAFGLYHYGTVLTVPFFIIKINGGNLNET